MLSLRYFVLLKMLYIFKYIGISIKNNNLKFILIFMFYVNSLSFIYYFRKLLYMYVKCKYIILLVLYIYWIFCICLIYFNIRLSYFKCSKLEFWDYMFKNVFGW